MKQASWGFVVVAVFFTLVGFYLGRRYEYADQDVEILMQTKEEMGEMELKLRGAMDAVSELEQRADNIRALVGGLEDSARGVRRALQGVRPKREVPEPTSKVPPPMSKSKSKSAPAGS